VGNRPCNHVDHLGLVLAEYKVGSAKASVLNNDDFYQLPGTGPLTDGAWVKDWPEKIADCEECTLKLKGALYGRISIKEEYLGRRSLPSDPLPFQIQQREDQDRTQYAVVETHERVHEKIQGEHWNSLVTDFNPWDNHVFKRVNCCRVWKRYINAASELEKADAQVKHAEWDIQDDSKNYLQSATEAYNKAKAYFDLLGDPAKDANCSHENE
jgi:hypothetical protein